MALPANICVQVLPLSVDRQIRRRLCRAVGEGGVNDDRAGGAEVRINGDLE